MQWHGDRDEDARESATSDGDAEIVVERHSTTQSRMSPGTARPGRGSRPRAIGRRCSRWSSRRRCRPRLKQRNPYRVLLTWDARNPPELHRSPGGLLLGAHDSATGGPWDDNVRDARTSWQANSMWLTKRRRKWGNVSLADEPIKSASSNRTQTLPQSQHMNGPPTSTSSGGPRGWPTQRVQPRMLR
jgi:hypothetical protein